MSKILFSLLLAAAGPAFAFDLPAMDAAGVNGLPAVPAAPAAVKAPSQHVWMSVTNGQGEARGSDWNNRIETEVRAENNGRFAVNLRTDLVYTWASISKSGSNYNLWGSGLNLNMYGSGSYYRVSGSYFENGRTVFVNVNVSGGSDGYSYNAYGTGLNLYGSRGTINGWFDAELMPKKALAAVTAFILTLQVEAAQPAR